MDLFRIWAYFELFPVFSSWAYFEDDVPTLQIDIIRVMSSLAVFGISDACFCMQSILIHYS